MSLSRPNFFPGQLIDYKDFNRLASQTDSKNSLLLQHLFQGGGVVAGALESFGIDMLKGLSVMVKPGLALLPTGEPCLLNRETVLDLNAYAMTKEAKSFVVSLRNVSRGSDRYQDPEDASIVGFRTELNEAEFVVSESTLPGAIELFRVTLAQSTTTLRPMTAEESWNENDRLELDSEVTSVIDLRFQKRLLSSTQTAAETPQLLRLRKSLYTIEKAQRRLGQIYLIEDPFFVGLLVTQLHAEVLAQPVQPLKVSFLVSQLAEKLSLYLELVCSRVGNQTANFDKANTLALIEKLESLKSREARIGNVPLEPLFQITEGMLALVNHAESSFNLLNTVEAAIRDLRDRLVEWEDKLVLGGQLFKRVDRLTAEDNTRVQFKSALTQTRLLQTKFNNGDNLSLKGIFIRSGSLTINLKVDHPERPLVLLSRQYIRRGGSTIHYEINGRPILTDQGNASELTNSWINRGIVVPAEYLTGDGNQLKIELEKSDLDFGFFDLVVYQPVVHQEILP